MQHLIKELEALVDRRVAAKLVEQGKDLDRYEALKGEVEQELANAQALYDDFKAQGLSMGMVEAEGFLRGLKTMQGLFSIVEGWYPLDPAAQETED